MTNYVHYLCDIGVHNHVKILTDTTQTF